MQLVRSHPDPRIAMSQSWSLLDLLPSDTIPGNGKLGLWQAFYNAPGVDMSLNDTRSGGEPPASETVQLTVTMQQLQFIEGFRVGLTILTLPPLMLTE